MVGARLAQRSGVVMACGHAVGCTAIGVATGHHDAAALREAGADRVIPTLEAELPLR